MLDEQQLQRDVDFMFRDREPLGLYQIIPWMDEKSDLPDDVKQVIRELPEQDYDRRTLLSAIEERYALKHP